MRSQPPPLKMTMRFPAKSSACLPARSEYRNKTSLRTRIRATQSNACGLRAGSHVPERPVTNRHGPAPVQCRAAGQAALGVLRHEEADAARTILPIPSSAGAGRSRGASGSLPDWLVAADKTTAWTTSGCTGSLILARAGLLSDRAAATNRMTVDEPRRLGAVPGRSATCSTASTSPARASRPASTWPWPGGPDSGRQGGAAYPARHRVPPAAVGPVPPPPSRRLPRGSWPAVTSPAARPPGGIK